MMTVEEIGKWMADQVKEQEEFRERLESIEKKLNEYSVCYTTGTSMIEKSADDDVSWLIEQARILA